MGFVKTNRSEKTEVLSPSQHRSAEEALGRLGKTSAKDLTEDERLSLRRSIDRPA